jgi:hypothetical protein
VAAPTRECHGTFSGKENDLGEDLFDDLAKLRSLSLSTATLIKQAWAPETFRHMRHSWRLLKEFLTQRSISLESFCSEQGGFIVSEFQGQQALAMKKNAWNPLCSHTTTLFNIFQPSAVLRTSLLRRVVNRREPGKQKKYSSMWDISQLLSHIRKHYPDNNSLSLHQLLTKTIVLVMIFAACRFPELTRMSVDPLGTSADQLTLMTITKTHLDERTAITFRPLRQADICPCSAVRVWLDRTGLDGNPLLVDPITHRPLKQKAISAEVRRVFTEAGIPPVYGAYSVKHAVVSFLFSRGIEEWRINDFGRWSPNSTVASTFYRVSTKDPEWLGFEIARVLDPAPGEAPA